MNTITHYGWLSTQHLTHHYGMTALILILSIGFGLWIFLSTNKELVKVKEPINKRRS